jgi:hypothetical protein
MDFDTSSKNDFIQDQILAIEKRFGPAMALEMLSMARVCTSMLENTEYPTLLASLDHDDAYVIYASMRCMLEFNMIRKLQNQSFSDHSMMESITDLIQYLHGSCRIQESKLIGQNNESTTTTTITTQPRKSIRNAHQLAQHFVSIHEQKKMVEESTATACKKPKLN